ncbi:hypothetical protein KC352_g42 [Hortaea werneckii]|nr:hypothetical protein KC352_g42 [Hortaea werneckii]
MGQVSLLNVEYTAPLSLIPGLGVDKAHRVIDRDLVASSKWITAKLARWSGDDVSTTPQLEVMGDGKSVSNYVAIAAASTATTSTTSSSTCQPVSPGFCVNSAGGASLVTRITFRSSCVIL